MTLDDALRSNPEDEAVESLRKINELLFFIAKTMAPEPPTPPASGEA